MPLATIASAVSRINCSLTLQPNLFQLFQPICGVFASPSNFWATAPDPYSVNADKKAILIMRIPGLLRLLHVLSSKPNPGPRATSSARAGYARRISPREGQDGTLRH